MLASNVTWRSSSDRRPSMRRVGAEGMGESKSPSNPAHGCKPLTSAKRLRADDRLWRCVRAPGSESGSADVSAGSSACLGPRATRRGKLQRRRFLNGQGADDRRWRYVRAPGDDMAAREIGFAIDRSSTSMRPMRVLLESRHFVGQRACSRSDVPREQARCLR